MRNIMEVCPAKQKPQLKEDLPELWASKNQVIARERLHRILETYSEKAFKAMRTLEEGFDDATAVL
jgi:putative transposase